jgi:hypothetical protein
VDFLGLYLLSLIGFWGFFSNFRLIKSIFPLFLAFLNLKAHTITLKNKINESIIINQLWLPVKKLGMHRISGRPDNPAFFDIRYPTGYQTGQPDIR